MSEWVARITNHAVWETLKQVGSAVDLASRRTGNTAASIEGIERVRAVLTFCGQRLAAVDPVLPSPSTLDGINKHAALVASELTAYASDGDIAHIAVANTRADNMLSATAALPAAQSPEDLKAIGESAAGYRLQLSTWLGELEATRGALVAKADNLTAQLSSLEKQFSEERARATAAAAEQQAKFVEAQEGRVHDFAAAQTDRQEKANAALTEHQVQFSSGQELRTKEHAEAQADRAARFSALTEDYTKKLAEQNAEFHAQRDVAINHYETVLSELRQTFAEKAEGMLAEILEHKGAVEKLVGVIGNLGVTSGYLKAANHARVALYVWQGLTVVALAGLIYVAYFIATSEPNTDLAFYRALAGRVFLSVAVGVFAAYAAKQAANFWQVERRNRKLALELEALGPYIAPLPLDQQNKFREELGQRSFGVPDGDAQRSDAGPVTLLDVMKMKEFREFVAEVVKAAK